MDIVVEKLNLKNPYEVKEVSEFLEMFDLKFEDGIDYSVAARKNGEIIGTCSKERSVLKCFAIDKSIQGEGLTNKMIKNLQDKMFEEGIYHSFIFTKPEYKDSFMSLGYTEVERSEKVLLLEGGFGNIKKKLEKISKDFDIDKEKPKTAIVMNCNPFTKGHRYLVEKASNSSEEVIIFVVEEEKSIFPFDVRYKVLKKGVEDLKNVKVIPGGEYIISSATFPGYFLKGKAEKIKEHTVLDAKIFARYFCQYFNINKRVVGEEPYCDVTRAYNESVKKILEGNGVQVDVIKRKEDEKGAISASRIRQSIKENKGVKLEELEGVLPKVTFDYLLSEDGKKIIEKIINAKSRH